MPATGRLFDVDPAELEGVGKRSFITDAAPARHLPVSPDFTSLVDHPADCPTPSPSIRPRKARACVLARAASIDVVGSPRSLGAQNQRPRRGLLARNWSGDESSSGRFGVKTWTRCAITVRGCAPATAFLA